MVNTIRHALNRRTTDDTDWGMSQALWHDCPIASIKEDQAIGIFRRFEPGTEGFKLSTSVNAAEAYWSNGFLLFGSDGGAVARYDAQGGGITLSADGDNEGVGLQLANAPLEISRDHYDLWFEAALRTSTIADTKHGILVGLAEILGLSATVPIAAAGTLADKNFVGFHRLEGDGDALDVVYKADGVTQVTVKADAATIAADTFFKVGMRFRRGRHPFLHDPDRDYGSGAYIMSFFFNGRELADVKQIPSTDGDDFPNDVRLAPFLSILNATATTPGNTTLHWAQWAQVYNTGEVPV